MSAGPFPLSEAARAGASVLCFPACYLPGYRNPDRRLPPSDARTLESAWTTLAETTRRAGIPVIVGTERLAAHGLHAAAFVLNPEGARAGFEHKVPIDPSEEGVYPPSRSPSACRRTLRFGVSICHEGSHYPETVRWAARHGAHLGPPRTPATSPRSAMCEQPFRHPRPSAGRSRSDAGHEPVRPPPPAR
jgi:predicted amidohydrolase